jgi:CheY-like chemotaxis protein
MEKPLVGLRILLVEDDPDTRMLMSVMLRLSGANVSAVRSASEARETLRVQDFDLLLSDIRMPEEDGWDLIQKVRALESEKSTMPALAVSAFNTREDQARSLAAGFQAHLAKPLTQPDLERAIGRVLGRKEIGPN